MNDRCSGRVGGREAGRAPGEPRGGSLFGGHLSRAGGSRVSSRRLLFREGEGRGSLSPSRIESGRSDFWKRDVGQNCASCDHSFLVITHSAPGDGPVVTLIDTRQEASDAVLKLRVVCRRRPPPFFASF